MQNSNTWLTLWCSALLCNIFRPYVAQICVNLAPLPMFHASYLEKEPDFIIWSLIASAWCSLHTQTKKWFGNFWARVKGYWISNDWLDCLHLVISSMSTLVWLTYLIQNLTKILSHHRLSHNVDSHQFHTGWYNLYYQYKNVPSSKRPPLGNVPPISSLLW